MNKIILIFLLFLMPKLAFSKSVTGQVENPARLKQIRREIARLHTVITEKSAE